MTAMIIDGLQGVWTGYSAITFKQYEDSARVGVHRYLTAVSQIVEVSSVIEVAGRLLPYVSAMTEVSTPVVLAAYALPIATNFLCTKFDLKDDPKIKRALLTINQYTGSVAQVAILVLSIALIFFGETIFGGCTLAFIIAGYAQRHFMINNNLREAVHHVGFTITTVCRLVLGDILEKITGLLDAVAAYEKYDQSPITVTRKPLPLLINFAQLQRATLEIDANYAKLVSPPIEDLPDIDVESINTLWSALDFSRKKEEICSLVTADKYWGEHYSDQTSNDDLFNYVQNGLQNLIVAVTEEKIDAGRVRAYEIIQRKLKHISKALSEKTQDEQFTTLLNLGITYYKCPPAYIEMIDKLYMELCTTAGSSIDTRVAKKINDSRLSKMNQFLKEYFKGLPTFMKGISAPTEDIHDNSMYANTLSRHLCFISTDAQENDELAIVDTLSRKLLVYIMQDSMEIMGAKETPKIARETLVKEFDNQRSSIKYEDYQEWLIERYKSETSCDDATAKAWVQKNVFDETSVGYNKDLMNYFLIDIGVLRIT